MARSPREPESRKAVYAALLGNTLVAVTKLAAALLSGSSSMMSEAAHSVVDTGNQALLLYGYRRSEQQPDRSHPLGYGRELYFWSFMVAVLLFIAGAGVSFYEGLVHIRTARPIEYVTVNYVVLALSFIFEASSWFVAFGIFRKRKGARSYWQAVRDSKDPPAFMVLFEDSAALIGIAIAAGGIFLADRTGIPELDGVASVMIGVVLGTAALLVARESKELLIGEQASARITSSIVELARSEPGIEDASSVFTVHLAPQQIVAALNLEFADDFRAPQIEAATCSLEQKVREKHPEIVALFVKPRAQADSTVSGPHHASAAHTRM